MKFEELGLTPVKCENKEIFINGVSVKVKSFLSIQEKIDVISWIIQNAQNQNTGIVSSVKVSVYLALALVKWYTDIELPEGIDDRVIYDLLNTNKVFDTIVNNIDNTDYNNLINLLQQTIDEGTKYNFSALGILNNMTSSSAGLAEQAQKIINEVKAGKDLELLSEIKNITGQN